MPRPYPPTVAIARTGARTKVKTTNTVSSCLRREGGAEVRESFIPRIPFCLGPKRAIASRQWPDVRAPAPPCPGAKPRKQKSLQRPGEKESGVTRKIRRPARAGRRLRARAFFANARPADAWSRLSAAPSCALQPSHAICPAARMIGTGRKAWRGLNSGRVKPGAKTSAPRELVKIGSGNIVYPSKKANTRPCRPPPLSMTPACLRSAIKVGGRLQVCPCRGLIEIKFTTARLAPRGPKGCYLYCKELI